MHFRRALAASLALALALSACQTGVTPTTRHASPRVATKSALPSVAPTRSTATASATPPPASGRLQRPSGPVRELSGVVQLEAAYATAHGAAIISNNGAQVLTLGDASLISDQGSNLIARDGAAIISDNGAGILSNHGSGLISDNGGSIISDNGGGLVAQTAWRLLAGDEPAAEFGTVLPVAGLALGVVDLATGQMVSLGQDAAGRSAPLIVTDAQGGFHAFLSAAAEARLRVVGLPPTGADPRMRTALLTRGQEGPLLLDEDTAQVAADVRQIMVASFVRGMNVESGLIDTATSAFSSIVDAETSQAVNAGLKQMEAHYEAVNARAMPRARQVAIAERLADVVLAHVRIDEVRALTVEEMTKLHFPDPGTTDGQPDPPTALVMLEQTVRRMRQSVSLVMAAQVRAGVDPEAFFGAKAYIREAAERDGIAYAIRKPSDMIDFLARGILANPALNEAESVVAVSVVYDDPDVGLAYDDGKRFARAQLGFSLGFQKLIYSGEGAFTEVLLAAFDAAAASP